jgi:hypothetical protein
MCTASDRTKAIKNSRASSSGKVSIACTTDFS